MHVSAREEDDVDRGLTAFQLIRCELRRRPCLRHTARLACGLWAFAVVWMDAAAGGAGSDMGFMPLPLCLVSAAMFLVLTAFLMQGRGAVRATLHVVGVRSARILQVEMVRLALLTMPGALAGTLLAGAVLMVIGTVHVPWLNLVAGALVPTAVTLMLGLGFVLPVLAGSWRGGRA